MDDRSPTTKRPRFPSSSSNTSRASSTCSEPSSSTSRPGRTSSRTTSTRPPPQPSSGTQPTSSASHQTPSTTKPRSATGETRKPGRSSLKSLAPTQRGTPRITSRTFTTKPTAGSAPIAPDCTTSRWKPCSLVPRIRCAGRRFRSSRGGWKAATRVRPRCSTWLREPAGFSRSCAITGPSWTAPRWSSPRTTSTPCARATNGSTTALCTLNPARLNWWRPTARRCPSRMVPSTR
mmetsp:Transcript_8478/g.23649  ORF Transcript_8478/g.23649 Transcript_8478/m.23649 type:complete len:234 (+) Transcript_8478:389-1090(+)